MILSNQAECTKCGDKPYSASCHDYRKCKCGAIAVDGGLHYLRGTGAAGRDMSITIPDEAGKAAIEAIEWAIENKRNALGVLCAVARALRDNGVKISV